jgi:hypothetical protein
MSQRRQTPASAARTCRSCRAGATHPVYLADHDLSGHFPVLPADKRGRAGAALAVAGVGLIVWPVCIVAVVLAWPVLYRDRGPRPRGYSAAAAAAALACIEAVVLVASVALIIVHASHPIGI